MSHTSVVRRHRRGSAGARTSVLLTAALTLTGLLTAPLAAATQAPVPVSTCDARITGAAVLTQDLQCPQTAAPWLEPGASLDLAGHTVHGTQGGLGIRVAPTGHATVRNGTVSGFEIGISRDWGESYPPLPHEGTLPVEGVTFRGTMIGVEAHLGHLVVLGSTFRENTAGVWCYTTCEIRRSTFVENSGGVLTAATGVVVTDSTFRGHQGIAYQSYDPDVTRFTDRTPHRLERNTFFDNATALDLGDIGAVVRANVLRRNDVAVHAYDWTPGTPFPRGRLLEHNTFVENDVVVDSSSAHLSARGNLVVGTPGGTLGGARDLGGNVVLP